MASYEYSVTAGGKDRPATDSRCAVAICHDVLRVEPVGAVGKVERMELGRAAFRGPWLLHRAYVVDPGGVVRRTDRTPAK